VIELGGDPTLAAHVLQFPRGRRGGQRATGTDGKPAIPTKNGPHGPSDAKRATGLEPATFSLEGGQPLPQGADTPSTYNAGIPTPSDTPSDSGQKSPSDPDLRRVVGAWPDLPPAIRAGIVVMVAAWCRSGGTGGG
jgi:hypothetical protein